MNFICDTDILSSIGKIDQFDLLRTLFPKGEFHIPEQLYNELSAASYLGFDFPVRKLQFVDVVPPSETELSYYLELRDDNQSLGKGELQCISIADHRKWFMLTDDNRAKRTARTMGIVVWDILDILKALLVLELISKEEVEQIIADLERKDGMIIADHERIFKG